MGAPSGPSCRALLVARPPRRVRSRRAGRGPDQTGMVGASAYRKASLMRLMHVVDRAVEGDGAYGRLAAHLAEWLNDPLVRLAPLDLATNGMRELAAARTPGGDHPRHGDWEVSEAGGDRALKLVVSQAVGTGLESSTRVTVSSISGAVRLRVGIGRETTNQRLVPVGTTDISQPGALRLLDQDENLTLRARGRLVNRRCIPVKTAAEADAVVDILTSEDRLPLALVHARSTEHREGTLEKAAGARPDSDGECRDCADHRRGARGRARSLRWARHHMARPGGGLSDRLGGAIERTGRG